MSRGLSKAKLPRIYSEIIITFKISAETKIEDDWNILKILNIVAFLPLSNKECLLTKIRVKHIS